MRAPRISADEQFRLIMECRASGLTDYEWCLQNDIKPGTFYNWVKRLRQKGCIDIPDTMFLFYHKKGGCPTRAPTLVIPSTLVSKPHLRCGSGERMNIS